MLAFERMFLLAGIAFLFVIPLALLLKAPARHARQARRTFTNNEREKQTWKALHNLPLESTSPQRRRPRRSRRRTGRRRGATADAPARRKRRPFVILGRHRRRRRSAVVGVYTLLTAGRENTDDAQIAADVVPVAHPRRRARSRASHVNENQLVKRGDLLSRSIPATTTRACSRPRPSSPRRRRRPPAPTRRCEIVEATSKGGLATARAALSGSTAGVPERRRADRRRARRGRPRRRRAAARREIDLDRARTLAPGQRRAAGAARRRADRVRRGAGRQGAGRRAGRAGRGRPPRRREPGRRGARPRQPERADRAADRGGARQRRSGQRPRAQRRGGAGARQAAARLHARSSRPPTASPRS